MAMQEAAHGPQPANAVPATSFINDARTMIAGFIAISTLLSRFGVKMPKFVTDTESEIESLGLAGGAQKPG